MFKTLAVLLATAAFAASSAIALADATSGKGDGKGREGIAAAVSGTPGTANVASTANGGWGQAGGVANENARSFETKSK